MSAVTEPTDADWALYDILTDRTGVALAEFAFEHQHGPDGRFRLWDYQWPWYLDDNKEQIDQAARAVGKSESIQLRACAFPFSFPGQQMAIVAPYANQMNLLTQPIEKRMLGSRIMRETLARRQGSDGINRSGRWNAAFVTGATIETRIPGKDGAGVKGLHAVVIEADEMQDFHPQGWIELGPTFESHLPGAQWRVHGVTNGVRDQFWRLTQKDSGWKVHNPMRMQKPGWSAAERQSEIMKAGGSRATGDYQRNVYGLHGDKMNPVFILAKMYNCLDDNKESEYNTEVYTHIEVNREVLEESNWQELLFDAIPHTHLKGWKGMDSPTAKKKGWGAPDGYEWFEMGADMGLTDAPTEILVWGARREVDAAGKGEFTRRDTLLRLTLRQIVSPEQVNAILMLFAFYGRRLRTFGMDSTGVGLPIFQELLTKPGIKDRVFGYNASTNVPTQQLDPDTTPNWDLLSETDRWVYRNVIEHATDDLRNNWVHAGALLLPNDIDMFNEWQGQSVHTNASPGNPYGKKTYQRGKFHSLDAAKNLRAAATLPDILQLTREPVAEQVLDIIGGFAASF